MQLPKPNENADYENPPAGTFIATCYRFVDLGTQITKWAGREKFQRKVLISWELSDEPMSDGRPFTISKRYTWSMSEKSNLRHDLESWRGLAFTEADFEGPTAFNTKKLIGVPCTLTIVHETKDGKTYANVAGLGKIVKGVQAPPLQNKTVYFALTEDGFDAETFGGLSDSLRSSIASSPEYAELMSARQKHDDPRNGFHSGHDPNDEIPF